jgi:DNA-binding CsgD family transcriptional regulator
MIVPKLWSFVLLFFCVIPYAVHSQELPPIQNFYPHEYHGENQNWAISQSSEKLIYVANSGGLLEFNGADWKLYTSPNESIMRSVQVIDDRIYTGCYMEFGFWQKDEFGTLIYTSISKKFEGDLIEDEEFWNIIEIEDWIVFQSLKRIYIYNVKDASINTIDSENTITRIFKVDQNIYFQKIGEGLFEIDKGEGFLVLANDIVKNNEVITIFPKGKDLLVLTQEGGFYDFVNNSFVKSNFAANELLSKESVYNAIQLRDKSFMIGTIGGGLIHISEKGDLLSQRNQDEGLSNNTVLALFEDLESNIWLGLDNGISLVNNSSPFKVFNDYRGALGSIYASAVSNGNLYLGTNQGLYYRKSKTNDRFKPIEGTEGQVWALMEIDGSLFCGHNTGTFIINGNRANKIADIQGTWGIAKFDQNDNFLLQGNYDGLYVLEKSNNTWKLRNKIKGFNNSARYFETLGDEIFVNHEYQGVFKLKVDSSFYKVKEVTIDTLLRGSNSGIVKYNGDLLYAYKKGVYEYNTSSKKFIKDSLISKLYTETDYDSGKLIADKSDDKLWVFTKSNIGYITQTGLSNTPTIKNIPLPKEIREGVPGYENITKLEGADKFLIGTTSGYIAVDLNKTKTKDFQVYISSVRNGIIRPIKDLGDKKRKHKFNIDENNLEISFYAPQYNKYLAINYQFQLKGIYDSWSNWSEKSTASFANLPHGDYTFNVRAKIGNTISNNTGTYAFEITKPWYLTDVMIALYVLSILLVSILIHHIYKRHYNKKHKDIIARNKRGLELLRVQAEKDIIKIKNHQLKAEYKSKSQELAASMMSITKKNELLRTIKDELKDSTEESAVKSVITIINKNLKQNNDWEFFQEAFNNADSEFLKKAKTLHPNLSPNDLKLCAYLRLNLSTKEMAKLLNIAQRSVEIKRYRLRKKLDLKHEDNLANYILSL